MAFQAQELAHKVTFDRKQEVIDPVTGYRTEEWVQVAEAYARVDPMLGRERLAALAVREHAETKFTMRYLTGITTHDRLKWNGEAWNVQSIVNVGGRNRETLIYATRTT
ncbi:phage head closure protein [Luteimonas sp. MJ250]|uniref:phage head closure protein n=1 Tax=Luteimonas sp. MJ250 TaxID=3129236 RepID=UPI0031BA7C53